VSWLAWVSMLVAWVLWVPGGVVIASRFDTWDYLRSARPRHVPAGELKKRREQRLNLYLAWGLFGPWGSIVMGMMWAALSSRDVLSRLTVTRVERRRTDLREIEGGTVREDRPAAKPCDILDGWCYTHQSQACARLASFPSRYCARHGRRGCCG
jgi:hypothetical protein